MDDIIDSLTSNESSPYWSMILPIVKSQSEYSSFNDAQSLKNFGNLVVEFDTLTDICNFKVFKFKINFYLLHKQMTYPLQVLGYF